MKKRDLLRGKRTMIRRLISGTKWGGWGSSLEWDDGWNEWTVEVMLYTRHDLMDLWGASLYNKVTGRVDLNLLETEIRGISKRFPEVIRIDLKHPAACEWDQTTIWRR